MPLAIASAIRNPVIVYLGRTRPSLFDTITRASGSAEGVAEDLSDAACKFSMRAIQSRVPVLDEVEARGFKPDDNGFNIAHDWVESEVEEEGEYMAWWTFTLSGDDHPQETSEFPILITDHGPGQGAQIGAIVEGVAGEIPVTFDALRNDSRFGDRYMQAKAELIKIRVLHANCAPDEEQNFNAVLLNYFSKRVALELIPPGIDYWSRQHRTVTTTGTSEVASYPDMIASLKELKSQLYCACREVWQELPFIVPGLVQFKQVNVPRTNLSGNPRAEEPLTINPENTQQLETGGFGWSLALGVFPFP